MSKYTMTLEDIARYDLELKGFDSDGVTDDELMRDMINGLFTFDYPLVSELRPIFEYRFVLHYWTEEIGCETPNLFKYYLKRFLYDNANIINERWKSTLLKFDPLSNTKMVQEYERDNKAVTDETAVTKVDSERDYTLDTTNKEIIGEIAEQNDIEKQITDSLVNEKGNVTKDTDTVNTAKHTGTDKTDTITTNTEVTDDTVTTNMNKSYTSTNTFYDTPQDEINAQAYDAAGNQIYGTNSDGTRYYANRDYATDMRKISDNTKDTGTVTDDKRVQDNGTKGETTTYNSTMTTTDDTVTRTDTDMDTQTDTTRDTTFKRNLSNDTTSDSDTKNVFEETTGKVSDLDHDVINTFTENYLTKKWGNNGGVTFNKLLAEMRENIVDVVGELVHKAHPLFMGIF